MLVPAITRKEELTKLFTEHIYDKNIFFFTGYLHANKIPTFELEENIYRWAIIDKSYLLKSEQTIGYFSYCIDTANDSVYGFSLYSFENNPVIGLSVYRKMEELIKSHHRVEWRMISGNPVQKHYDRFIKRFNGNRVQLHDAIKDGDGIYRDEYIYEIVKS